MSTSTQVTWERGDFLFSHHGFKVDGGSACGLGQAWASWWASKINCRLTGNWTDGWTEQNTPECITDMRKSHWKMLNYKEKDNSRCLVMTDECFLHLRVMGCKRAKKTVFFIVTLLWKHEAAGGLCSTARDHTLLNFLLLEVLSHCTKLFSRVWKGLLYSCTVGCWSNITTWISVAAERKIKLPVIFNGKMSHQLHFRNTLFFF